MRRFVRIWIATAIVTAGMLCLFGCMAPIATTVLVLPVPSNAPERAWRDALAIAWHGETEVRIPRGRIDLLTRTCVVEIDRSSKWHEGLGQALHYSNATGKKGVLAIIQREAEEIKDLAVIEQVCAAHGIAVVLLTSGTAVTSTQKGILAPATSFPACPPNGP